MTNVTKNKVNTMDNVHSPDSLLGTTSIALDSLLCTELLFLILRGIE